MIEGTLYESVAPVVSAVPVVSALAAAVKFDAAADPVPTAAVAAAAVASAAAFAVFDAAFFRRRPSPQRV